MTKMLLIEEDKKPIRKIPKYKVNTACALPRYGFLSFVLLCLIAVTILEFELQSSTCCVSHISWVHPILQNIHCIRSLYR